MRTILERTFVTVKHPPAITVRATCAAPPQVLWQALADPEWWPRWAPHIVAVDTTGDGLVVPGQRLRVRGPGPIAVPTTVTRVVPGRAWDFRVRLAGPLTMTSRHVVQAHRHGSVVTVTMTLEGTGAVTAWPLLAAYRPLAAAAVRRLARLAVSARVPPAS